MSTQDDTADKQKEDLAEGTLISHLVELRDRLLRISIATVVVFVCLLPFARQIFTFVAEPIRQSAPDGVLYAMNPASPLLTPFKLTFFVALFIAMPVVLYQVWSFVAPGLYRKEKKFAIPLLATSILLFYCGVAFAYFIVFPMMFSFFADYAPDNVNVTPDISMYLDFITTIVLAFGLAFEVPIAAVLVVWTGLTTPQKLGAARPYVFLGAFVVGMLLTPPDIISQTMLAVPVYVLYELGIFMSRAFVRKEETESEEAQG
jgi:sec-independent protein translocase protein TatC